MTKLLITLLFFSLSGCMANYGLDDSPLTRANSYTAEAIEAFDHANWQITQRLFKRALKQYQSIDYLPGILQSYINLVELSLSNRQSNQALEFLNKAQLIVDDPTLSHYRPHLRYLYARYALQQKQLVKANTLLHTLLPDFDQDNMPLKLDHLQLAALASRVKLAFILNEDRAIWIERFEKSLPQIKNALLIARLLRFQAVLQRERYMPFQAESSLQQALVLYKQNLHRFGIAITLYELGQLYLNYWGKAKAEGLFIRSLAVFRSLGHSQRQQQIQKILVSY